MRHSPIKTASPTPDLRRVVQSPRHASPFIFHSSAHASCARADLPAFQCLLEEIDADYWTLASTPSIKGNTARRPRRYSRSLLQTASSPTALWRLANSLALTVALPNAYSLA